METKLIIEYIVFQLLFIILAIFSWKRMLKLWKKDEKNNGYGIGSSFGVIGACILMSVLLYITIFERKLSFLHEMLNIFFEN